ncbi:hypothetical protein AB0383_49720 [Amycolatopsis sp. NPDC051373]|uniref:hypothetical protein n=1 Tax=Amycolatopsis sp. NPDC051373 TaxID=3155801 RepID=UPI00344CDF76
MFIEHPSAVPLSANWVVTRTLILDQSTVKSHSTLGGVNLSMAQIGAVSCAGATLHNDSGPAVYADWLQADGGVLLKDEFSATGAGELGAVRLLGARIRGQLNCAGATLRNDSGPALYADLLHTDGGVLLNDGFSATGAGKHSAVRLLGAHIGSQLNCIGATLRNDSGPALDADGLLADSDVGLFDGFSAVGAGELGAVRLTGAHIGGQLNCAGATLRNDSGPALSADRLQSDGGAHLRDGFSAIGAGELGAVRLTGAHIGGQLACDQATLRNDSGPALYADRLQTDRDVFLGDGFSATGAGELGAVRLTGAHIGSHLDFAGATLRNDSGPALKADGLQSNGPVSLDGSFSATGAGKNVVLDLTDLRVKGTLFFGPTRLEHIHDAHARLAVDGLVYPGLSYGTSTGSWLRLLREATPVYSAQPYQQLAAAQRSAGHDREARRVLIQQRRDQIHRRALTGRAERTWARLTGLLLGYGYQPWRALWGLLATLILAALITTLLGAHGGLAQVQTPPTPTPAACTLLERLGVGLDLGTPLISTGERAHCDTTNSTTGQALTVLGWGLRLLAWSFATLFIAGFTGAVRKT